MRVALVVTGGVDASGRDKVIPALLWFVEQMAKRVQLDVYVLRYLDRPTTYPLLGATVHDLGSPRGLAHQHLELVHALRRDGPFDVIHAYWALPAGFSAVTAARRLRTPSIVTLDSGELVSIPDIKYGSQYRTRQRLAVAQTLRMATRLTVCTNFMHRRLRSHHRTADVIPLGIDTTRFPPAHREPGPPSRLVHIASLNPVKDQSTLLDAFAYVTKRIADVHLDIAGEDTLGGTVHQLARQLGVEGQVTFHGVMPTDQIAQLLQRSHLLVVSSRHEAAGVVALEAAASRVAVVGTHVGYLADWAPDRAMTVPPEDANALGRAIVRLLEHADQRRQLAAAAREWTLAHDIHWTVEQFERVYREIQGSAGSQGSAAGSQGSAGSRGSQGS